MLCEYNYEEVADDADWARLRGELDPKGLSAILEDVLARFREAGAVLALEESTYLDRDFSAAYAAFYSTLYSTRPRYCRRVHFFSSTLDEVWASADIGQQAAQLAAAAPDYRGYVVIRPLTHAPVGNALVSSPHLVGRGVEIPVRATYKVHLLGAELEVEGVPVTEQDRRTGSCAQATIWTAGRHFHTRHSMPWFSLPDITDAALKPTDSMLARSLPAGSDFLTDDNMVRALRAMGEHPIIYGPEPDDSWDPAPERTIARYLDSGIPVIVGMGKGERVGHAVVAVGSVTATDGPWPDGVANASVADRITHFLVNDDQGGPYARLPVKAPGVGAEGYSLEDAIFLMVPLPPKVFMKAEVAETLARDRVRLVAGNRASHIKEGKRDPKFWNVDPDFYATAAGDLVARTYLTHGWKYKHRLIRNTVAEELKDEVAWVHLPRYVWVTEFSLAGDLDDFDPCRRRVRAHVVVDATGSKHEDPVLLTHLPGIVIGQSFDPDLPSEPTIIGLRVLDADAPYHAKIRGQLDFDGCSEAE